MNIVNCLFPKRVRNKYTGEILHVPCRHCSACRNARAMELVNRLTFEGQNNKFVLFFTLTYAPEFVPKFELVHDKNDILICSAEIPVSQVHGINFVQDLDEYGRPYVYSRFSELPKEVREDEASREVLERAIQTDHFFNVVNKKHCQDFIKRLRFTLQNKFENAKLRYFLVSEYGCSKTSNYRPHYHGLLFFDSEKFKKSAYKVLCETWKYGFVSCSTPYGNCASYVAKYINSNSVYPRIYNTYFAKPFYLFSKNPAVGVPKDESVFVKEIVFNGTNDIMLFTKTKIMSISFYKSIESRFFPKCRDFSKITHCDRMQLYSINVARQTDKKAKKELDLCFDDKELEDRRVASRVQYLADMLHVSLEWYVKRIEDYYITKSLLTLSKFYEYQVQVADQNKLDELVHCYPEAVNEFKNWWREHILPNVDFLQFGVDAFSVDNYLFQKFNPYFKMSTFEDWLSFDLSKFDLFQTTEYKRFRFDSNKKENDSLKTKKLNSIKNVI